MIGLSPLELLLIVGLLAIVVGIPAVVVLISMSIFGVKNEDRERRD
jgi:hypothetical protein